MNRKDYEGEITTELLEEGNVVLLDFEKLRKVAQSEDPVVPVAVKDVDSNEVILVAYVNEKALKHTIETGNATFWSTSRQVLWEKGLTSGDVLKMVDIRTNCEQNSLLYLVKMVGKGSCHTKKADQQTRFGCYYRSIKDGKLEFVDQGLYAE